MKKLWLLPLAALAVFAFAFVGCELPAGPTFDLTPPPPPPQTGEWVDDWFVLSDYLEELELEPGMVVGTSDLNAEDGPVFLQKAGSSTVTVIDAGEELGDEFEGLLGLKIEAPSNSWDGLDLRFPGFQFAENDIIYAAGKVEGGEVLFNAAPQNGQNFLGGGAVMATAGNWEAEFTLDEGQVTTIMSDTVSGIRISMDARPSTLILGYLSVSGERGGYVPVTRIINVPEYGYATVPVDFSSATVFPPNATNKEIVWSVKTGTASFIVDEDEETVTLLAPAAGELVVVATIANGKSETEDYVEEFDVEIHPFQAPYEHGDEEEDDATTFPELAGHGFTGQVMVHKNPEILYYSGGTNTASWDEYSGYVTISDNGNDRWSYNFPDGWENYDTVTLYFGYKDATKPDGSGGFNLKAGGDGTYSGVPQADGEVFASRYPWLSNLANAPAGSNAPDDSTANKILVADLGHSSLASGFGTFTPGITSQGQNGPYSILIYMVVFSN